MKRKNYTGNCLNGERCFFTKPSGQRTDSCVKCNRDINETSFRNHFCKGNKDYKGICAECKTYTKPKKDDETWKEYRREMSRIRFQAFGTGGGRDMTKYRDYQRTYHKDYYHRVIKLNKRLGELN